MVNRFKRPSRLPVMASTERFARLQELSGNDLVALRHDIDVQRNLYGAATNKLRVEAEAITAILRQRERPRFEISDHAVVRYLEKFKGFDVAAVRAEIVDRLVKAADAAPGTVINRSRGDVVSYSDGEVTFVVARINTCVTVHRGDREDFAK